MLHARQRRATGLRRTYSTVEKSISRLMAPGTGNLHTVGVVFLIVLQASNHCHCMCRDLSEVYLTLSSSGSSQWDLLQTVCEGSQLEALLTSGDFIALPLGLRPSQTSQVSPPEPAPSLNKSR